MPGGGGGGGGVTGKRWLTPGVVYTHITASLAHI